jgi:hypothetical protein
MGRRRDEDGLHVLPLIQQLGVGGERLRAGCPAGTGLKATVVGVADRGDLHRLDLLQLAEDGPALTSDADHGDRQRGAPPPRRRRDELRQQRERGERGTALHHEGASVARPVGSAGAGGGAFGTIGHGSSSPR